MEDVTILLGIEEITDTFEVGKSADFLVLDENPLDDLMMLANQRHVVMRSNLIETSAYEKVKVTKRIRPIAILPNA
jgi:hypothetical protein